MFDIGKKGAADKAQEFASREGYQREGSGPSETQAASRAPSADRGPRDAAVIGPSIHIDGDLRGEEDLVIEGEVNGTVQLKSNSLTIGSKGKVKANLYAHSIYVDGLVEGDLYGSERVSIRKTANVRGNITSPRVSLEDGARFKGSIEMDPQAVEAVLGTSRGAGKGAAPGAPSSAAKEQTSSGSKGNGEHAFSKTESGSGAAAAGKR